MSEFKNTLEVFHQNVKIIAQEMGLVTGKSTIRYSTDGSFTLTYRGFKKQEEPKETTDAALRAGFARPGTLAYLKWEGEFWPIIIIDTVRGRSRKYRVRWADPSFDETYTVTFTHPDLQASI